MNMKIVSVRVAVLVTSAAIANAASAPACAQEADPQEAEDNALRSDRSSDIIVTGQSLKKEETVLPVQVLAGDELAHRRQGGLGETLAGLPGVHLDNFGGGASRPVIRGQTVPRIEILTDGATLFDASSVSPDHAIITDPLLLDAIEVQRGPAATRYGGNAANGAINLIDSKVPKASPQGGISGSAEARYGTGDEERSIAGRVTAGIGLLAVHVEGSRRVSDDYDVPDSYGSDRLRDSFAEATSYSLGASWVVPNGYVGAAYTRQESKYGLPGHSHTNAVCHTHGIDLHCDTHGNETDPILGTDDSHTAFIDLHSNRFDIRADLDRPLRGLEHLRLRLSYTDYQHDEVDGDILFARYGNEVYDGRLELTHTPVLGFTGTFGVHYTEGLFSGLNRNNVSEFVRNTQNFLDLRTRNYALFVDERRTFGPVTVSIAARQDWRTIEPVRQDPYNYVFWRPDYLPTPARIESINRRTNAYWDENWPIAEHNPFSAAIGANLSMGGGYSVALNLARTERAPSVRELYALGNNLATNSYEVGLIRTREASSSFPDRQIDVEEENSSIDLTLRKSGGRLEFEVGLYYQNIDNYVFARLIEEERESGIPHRYLMYVSADTTFAGLDGQISYRITPESRVTVFGDYVRARMTSEDDNLPRMPPGRLGARYEHRAGPFSGDIEYYHTFAQTRFASYERQTDGYETVNATLAYRLDLGAARNVEVYVRGRNLTNELAFVHTSFVRDQSPLRGRSVAFGIRHAF